MIPNVSIAPAGRQSAFPAQMQKRKRLPRAAIACNMCRARKSRCNQDTPTCSHCLHYGFECTYPAKRQQRRTRASQEPSPRGALAPVPSASNILAASSPASAVEHLSAFPTLFDGSTLPRIETQQSMVFSQTVSNERRSAEEDVRLRTSRIPDLLSQYGRPRDQESEREAQLNRSDISQQSINPVPVDSRTSVHGSADIAGSDSVDEINNHTTGAEFFGPSGTLPFLARLLARSRVSAQHDAIPATDGRPASNHDNLDPSQLSLVSFLHSEDYPVPTRQHSPEQYHTPERYFPPGRTQNADSRSAGVDLSSTGPRFESPAMHPDHSGTQPRSQDSQPTLQQKGDMLTSPPINHPIISHPDQVDMEKRCVNLFFTNLHYIHPILQKSSFIARCAREVWSESRKQEPRSPRPAHRSRFLALYNAVCAVGAITADEGTIFGSVITGTPGELPPTTPDAPSKKTPKAIYPPLKLARVFFEQAKLNLGDVFEICSLESTQALFLMSVFCQNALKPHSCYMYSGMAARTALAIGITNVKAKDSLVNRMAASNLWWCIYAHEIEMCCASGRDTLLKRPEYYSALLAPIDETPDLDKHIVGAMVSFAKILQVASEELYHPLREKSLVQLSETAIELDDALQQWKSNLPPILNIDKASLRDPEWLGKQKVVLKLRFCNARIILHRQFLIASGTHDLETFSRHINLCLDASRQTIRLLYETYLNRHYFRTWWYNTTYVLYASMIILYLILLDFNKGDSEVLVEDVEKSLEILGSMDKVHVAHGCAQLISEVLDIAKKQISSRKAEAAVITLSNPSVNANPTQEPLEGGINLTREASEGAFDGEILSNLVDFNLLDNFAGFSNLDYFFGEGGKRPVDATVMRPGAYDSDGYPLIDAQDYLQGGEDGVLL